MNDMRSIIELLEKKAYKVKSDGSGIDNFNVDRDDPKIQIKRLSNGEVYDLHYKDEKQLEKGLANEKGFERFDADNVEGNLSLPKNEKLAAVVKKYAKPGITKEDLAAAENEAGSRSNATVVLAHIAKSLGLEGVYNQKGSFIYMDNGKPASAAGGNLDQAKDVAEKGLLPDKVADKIQKVADKNKERDPDKAQRFQDVVDANKGGDDTDEEPKGDKGSSGKITNDNAAKMIARYNDLIVKGKKKGESWQPQTFAEQLLQQLNEELSDEETSELQNMVLAFGQAVKDDSLQPEYKREIQRILDKWEQDKVDIGLFKDEEDPKADTGSMDYSSDEAIKQATSDVEAWIANEMPKELESKQAKGLLKATNRGKIKSASAAAVQTVLMRIGTANNNEELKKIKADGLYGPATIAGVKRAQELAGIKVDGDAGANTARELLDYSKNPQDAIDDAMKTDFARIQELVDKHNKPGETNSEESLDPMRSMIETLMRLDEALSDTEMEELKGLLDKHRAKLEDPETAQAYSQYAELFKTADAIAKEEPKGDTGGETTPPPKWSGNPDEFANAIFDAGEGDMFGTDESAIADILGKLPNKQAYDAVEKAFAGLSKFNTLNDSFKDEMNLRDRQKYVFPHFRRLGIEHSYGFIPGRDDAMKTANVKKINDKGGWAKQGSYDKDGKWVAGADAAKDTGGGASGYEYVGGPDRNGVAPQAEQDKNPDYIIAYWEGKKYFIIPKPTADGQYKGSTRAGGQDATVKELAPAVKVEVERRQKAGIQSNAKTGMDPNRLAGPKPGEAPKPGEGSVDAAQASAKSKSAVDNYAASVASAGTNTKTMTQSKDYGMKKAINEASMNISMTGDNAGEVGELLTMLKNAGMADAQPVADMPMYKDSHDDMKSHMATVDMPPEPSPCGMGEEEVEEDGYDNSPDEEYKDDNYMTGDLGNDMHRKKDRSAIRTTDPALETTIKDQLYKALEEKLQNK